MKISIIAAIGKNNEIGKDNDLIWNLPDDMKFFKEKTKKHVVVMGRKNYESIPEKWRPLPNRTNVVISNNKNLKLKDVTVFNDPLESIQFANNLNESELFIIGGGEIYKLFLDLDLIDVMYLTEIKSNFKADTFFPEINFKNWEEIERVYHAIDDKHKYEFDFVTYKKRP